MKFDATFENLLQEIRKLVSTFEACRLPEKKVEIIKDIYVLVKEAYIPHRLQEPEQEELELRLQRLDVELYNRSFFLMEEINRSTLSTEERATVHDVFQQVRQGMSPLIVQALANNSGEPEYALAEKNLLATYTLVG